MQRGRRLYNGVRLIESGPCLDNIERIDMGALPMLSYMVQRGLQVDLSHFARMEKTLTEDMDRITEEVRNLTGVYLNLGSGDQVSKLLFKTLGIKQARVKMTKSNSRESVEDEVLTAIQHEHEVVPHIQEYKEVEKLKGTYVVPMPKLARRVSSGEWRMFPNLGHTRVPSGRLNCKAPNLLAMPSRTDRGRQIRDGFITDTGWCFLSVDESQIEVRIAAHSSQDPNLIHIYEQAEDVYSDFAVSAFSLPDGRFQDPATGVWQYPSVDKMEHRYPSKTCILAAIYDVSAGGLLEQMPVICANCRKPTSTDKKGVALHDCGRFRSLWTEDKCQDILNAFYLRYPGLLHDRKRHHARARRYGYIWDMWGRLLHVAAVRSVHPWVVSSALREVGNFPYQCISRDSKVFVRGGGYKDIGELEGESATLWDGSEWSTGDIVATGVKPQIEITLHGGLSLKCSPDHLILTRSSKGIETWVPAGGLSAIDLKNRRVVVGGGISEEWNWNESFPVCVPLQGDKVTSDLSWAEENPTLFGEMLGRIASDGSVIRGSNGKPKVVYMLVAEHEKTILSTLELASILTLGKVRTTIQQKGDYAPLFRVEMGSRSLTQLFLDWGLKTRVPSFVWNNSEILRAYLRGMFDGDGGVSRDAVYLTFGGRNGRLPLAKDIQLALYLLGIRSRLHVHPDYIRVNVQKQDVPLFKSAVGFMNPRKQQALVDFTLATKTRAYYGRASAVESITHLPACSMVDFVHSSSGRFCAGGIVVHNSGAQGTIKLTMAAVQDDLEAAGALGDVCHPVLQIHDELLFEVRNDYRAEIAELVKHRFETCCDLRVPIKAGAASADTWGSIPK